MSENTAGLSVRGIKNSIVDLRRSVRELAESSPEGMTDEELDALMAEAFEDGPSGDNSENHITNP